MGKCDMNKPGWAGVWRVAGVLTVVTMLSAWWLLGKVHAELSERSITLGRSLTRAGMVHEGTTRLELNGQQLSLNTQVSALSAAELLQRFAVQCTRDSGGMEQALAAHAPRAGLRWDELGVFRSEQPEQLGEGTAACFANAGKDGLSGLLTRLRRTMETGDFAQLGQFRYMFARKVRGGPQTHVLTVWSDGPLALMNMFPEHGDAPGQDIAPGIRPPNAVRLLSARTRDSGFHNSTYESEGSVAEVQESYRRSLVERGYQAAIPADLLADIPVSARLYTRGAREQLLVMAQPTGTKTLVSALRIEAAGYVEMVQ